MYIHTHVYIHSETRFIKIFFQTLKTILSEAIPTTEFDQYIFTLN